MTKTLLQTLFLFCVEKHKALSSKQTDKAKGLVRPVEERAWIK